MSARSSPIADKLPPFSVEAEESVVASLLVADVYAPEYDFFAAVTAILQPQDFYREQNKWTYETCLALHGRGEGVNQVTVGHYLAQQVDRDGRSRLEDVGGAAYLSRLTTELPTPIGVEDYARIVKYCAVRRRVISYTANLCQRAYSDNGDLPGLLQHAQEGLDAAREMAVPVLGTSLERFSGLEGADLDAEMEERQFQVDCLVPDAGLTLLASPGESCKSLILMDILVSIAAGIPALDRFKTVQGRTALFDQESGEYEARRRLRKIASGRGLKFSDLPFRLASDLTLDLLSGTDLLMLENFIRSGPYVTLGFDSLTAYFPSVRVNNPDEMARAGRTLRSLAHSTGCAMIPIHHWNKPSKDSPSGVDYRILGAWKLRDESDSYFAPLRQGDAQLLVQCGKARRMSRWPPFVLTVDGDMDDPYLRLRYVGLATESLTVQDQAQGWLLQILAERGPMPKPDIVAAAAGEHIASPRSLDNALGRLVGSNSAARGRRPGERHGRMWYWMPSRPPWWVAAEQEAML